MRVGDAARRRGERRSHGIQKRQRDRRPHSLQHRAPGKPIYLDSLPTHPLPLRSGKGCFDDTETSVENL